MCLLYISLDNHNRLFRKHSTHPVIYHGTDEAKPNTTNAEVHKQGITQLEAK